MAHSKSDDQDVVVYLINDAGKIILWILIFIDLISYILVYHNKNSLFNKEISSIKL